MQVETVNLTWYAAQLKQNMTEDDKRGSGEGKRRYKQEDDLSKCKDISGVITGMHQGS